MNRSIHNSDVDANVNSILNSKPSPNSSFLAVSPFFSGQYIFNQQRTAQQDSKKFYNRLFQFPDFGVTNNLHKIIEQPRPGRTNLPAFKNWQAPLANLPENLNKSPLDFNEKDLSISKQYGKKKESGFEKVNFVEKVASTEVSTKSMVLLNPKLQPETNNFHLKDNIQEYNDQSFNHTTFYLRKFNSFSNKTGSVSTLDELPLELQKPEPSIKRSRKRISRQNTIKHKKIQPNEKRSKRKITCNCKNSSCIKMYCECFRENGFCGKFCKCKDCKNHEGNAERSLNLQNRNKKQNDGLVFKLSKDTLAEIPHRTKRNCKCQKSQCQKNYCECFNDGAFCSSRCCCINCLNDSN